MAQNALAFLTAKGIAYEKDVTLCGDSAGGCMAAFVSQRLQHDKDFPLRHQILIYPLLDFTGSFHRAGKLLSGNGLYGGQDGMVLQPVFPWP